MKTVAKLLVFASLAALLSGCVAAAVSAGAAGGYYLEKNYKVEKKNKNKQSSNKNDSSNSKKSSQ